MNNINLEYVKKYERVKLFRYYLVFGIVTLVPFACLSLIKIYNPEQISFFIYIVFVCVLFRVSYKDNSTGGLRFNPEFRVKEIKSCNYATKLTQALVKATRLTGLTSPPKLYIVHNGIGCYMTYEKTGMAIYIGSGLVCLMNEDELTALFIHEIVHHQTGDLYRSGILESTIFTVEIISMASVLILLSFMLAGGAAILYYITVFLNRFFYSLLVNYYNHSKEFFADFYSVYFMGSPRPMIRCLEKIKILLDEYKIYESSTSGLAKLFYKHPPVKDRIKILKR